MAALKFPEFLKRFQLQLLGVSNTDIRPGAVLARKRGFLFQGHLSDLLSDPPQEFWRVERNPANVVYGSVEREVSLRGRTSLDELGVRVEGGLRRARSAKLEITGVHASTFATGAATQLKLVPMLHTLRKVNRAAWRLVNGRWIVTETYYATEVLVSFATDGDVDLKSDIAAEGGVSVQGTAGVTWKGKRAFVVANNDQVPFAFRGWQV
jgi:hypothetical protein